MLDLDLGGSGALHCMCYVPPKPLLQLDILDSINAVLGVSLELDPKLCIMGYMVLRCLFKAWKLIAQKWLALDPPTSIEWVKI